jgi:hypothetical protein
VYMVQDDNNENRILKLERWVGLLPFLLASQWGGRRGEFISGNARMLMTDLVVYLSELSRLSVIILVKGNRRLGCTCLDWLLRRSLHSWRWVYFMQRGRKKDHWSKVLYENGYPVPVPIDQVRHCIVMSWIDSYPLWVSFESGKRSEGNWWSPDVKSILSNPHPISMQPSWNSLFG